MFCCCPMTFQMCVDVNHSGCCHQMDASGVVHDNDGDDDDGDDDGDDDDDTSAGYTRLSPPRRRRRRRLHATPPPRVHAPPHALPHAPPHAPPPAGGVSAASQYSERYEAESADELALVHAAHVYGCRLVSRSPHQVTVWLPGGCSANRFIHMPVSYLQKINNFALTIIYAVILCW